MHAQNADLTTLWLYRHMHNSVFSFLRQLTTWHCSQLLLNAALLCNLLPLLSTSWYPSTRSASPMIRDFQQTTVAGIGLLAQAKTVLWRSSQLRRHASSAIAMFPGLSHSGLAYTELQLCHYRQTYHPPSLLLLLTDADICPLAHLPLPGSSCRVRLRGGANVKVPCMSTLCI